VLTLIDVPKSGRRTGYMADEATTYIKGSMVVASGVFSAANITSLPAGQKNTPGFALAGVVKLVRGYAGCGKRAYPIDKIEFEPEDGDPDLDTVKKGEQVVYYTKGTFETTEFTDLGGSAVFGDYLKVTASGTLTIEATNDTETTDSVARVEALNAQTGPAKFHRLQFTLINVS